MDKNGDKSQVKMVCRNGIWNVSVDDFYGVHMIVIADSVRTALRGLECDMKYVEQGLRQALYRQEAS